MDFMLTCISTALKAWLGGFFIAVTVFCIIVVVVWIGELIQRAIT